jgi:integrase
MDFLREYHWQEDPIHDFDEKKAKLFVTWMEQTKRKKGKTIACTIQTVKAWFQWLIEEEFEQDNHFSKKNPFIKHISYKFVSKVRPAFKPFQMKLLKNLILETDPQLWLFDMFIYHCKLRPNELRYLQLQHIDFARRIINIPGEFSKNKKSQAVAITDGLAELIEKDGIMNFPEHFYVFTTDGYPGMKMVSANYFSEKFRRILRQLQFPTGFSNYTFKYTGNIDAALAGVPLHQLKDQNRHASLDQLYTYLQNHGAIDNSAIRRMPNPGD